MGRVAYRRDPIVEMHKQGLDNHQIAARLGMTPSRVATIVYEARKLGLLPPVKHLWSRSSVASCLHECGSKIGSMREIINSLGPEATVWLMKQVPEGASMAALIAAILTDIFMEEEQG